MARSGIWTASALAVVAAVSAIAAAAQTPAPSPASSAPTGAPAKAPASPPAPKPPIDITAAHQEVFNAERRVVYTGDVVSIQGDDRLTTPQLTIFYKKNDAATPKTQPADSGMQSAKVERMEAEGTVYFTTPTQNARGDHGTYLAAPDTITLIGNVVLVQGKNVSTGDKLVIDRRTDHSTLYSGQSSKRVRGVFYSDQPSDAGGASQKPGAAKTAAKPEGSTRP